MECFAKQIGEDLIVLVTKLGVDQGPMHGLPVSTPYMTKDFLETKRSQALRLETTYVYDFPEMFRMNLRDLWKEWRRKTNNTAAKTATTDVEMFFDCVELVLDNDGRRVVERKRYPGENDIAMVAWRMAFRMPGETQNRYVSTLKTPLALRPMRTLVWGVSDLCFSFSCLLINIAHKVPFPDFGL